MDTPESAPSPHTGPATLIWPERLAELESHSVMLGQIAGLVEEWAIPDECTTLHAVELALCELRELKARARRAEIEKMYGLR